MRGNLGGLNLTYSYQDVDMEDYEIPKGAALDMHEGHHDEEHEDEHEDHDEEHEEGHEEGHDMDKLANSDVSTTSHRIGLSTTGDWGYVGLSYSDLSSTYGIPFHSEAIASFALSRHPPAVFECSRTLSDTSSCQGYRGCTGFGVPKKFGCQC